MGFKTITITHDESLDLNIHIEKSPPDREIPTETREYIESGWEGEYGHRCFRYRENTRFSLIHFAMNKEWAYVYADMDTRPTSEIIQLFVNRALLGSGLKVYAGSMEITRWHGNYADWKVQLIPIT